MLRNSQSLILANSVFATSTENITGKKSTGGHVVKLIRRHYVRMELVNLPGTAPPQ